MMRIGNLDRRITIQRFTVIGKNELNEDIEDWADLATIWARRRDVSDGERAAAGQVGAVLMSRFVVRSSTLTRDLKATDRLAYDGHVWSIHGIKEVDEGRNRFLEITAAADLDDGI